MNYDADNEVSRIPLSVLCHNYTALTPTVAKTNEMSAILISTVVTS